MEAQEVSEQEQEVLADKVMDSLGEPEKAEAEHESVESGQTNEPNDKTLAVQKRIKQLKRQHEREIHALHARIADMQTQPAPTQTQPSNSYAAPTGGIDEQIHKAVSFALNHRDMEERKAKEAQHAAHMEKQKGNLYKHLYTMEDKYDDFHDVVFGDDSHFTNTMRDYSMTLPKSGAGSAGEVLYHLGKNPNELNRISKLHPIDQATEMAKLSHALISGGESKASSPRPLGQIKTNPVSHSGNKVTERTPISDIRKRMRDGAWK